MSDNNNNNNDVNTLPELPKDPTYVRNALGTINKKGDLSGLRNSEIKKEEVVFITAFSRGKFGEVWKARCRGTDVAVKKLFKRELLEKQLEEFRREVDILTEKQHPHICCFMGAHTTDIAEMWLIMELLEPVSVGGLLSNHVQIPMVRRVLMARDCSDGMSFLHHGNVEILHRDLKPDNLLIDAYWNVKVTDFGLSQVKLRDERMKDPRGPPGTPVYMAPEVLTGESISKAIDVYSFGLVLWEIITGYELFPQFRRYDEFKDAIVRQHHRPEHHTQNIHDEHINARLNKLMSLCWAHEPKVRPTFKQITRELEDILVDDCCKADRGGYTFWRSLSKTYEKKVPIDKFLTEYQHQFNINLPEQGHEFKSVVEFLGVHDNTGGIDDNEKIFVHLADYGNALNWFGPWDKQFSTRMMELLQKPWFHGFLNQVEAETILSSNFPSGTFLVRASKTKTAAPFTISFKRISDENVTVISHQRIYRKKGRYSFDSKGADPFPEFNIIDVIEKDVLKQLDLEVSFAASGSRFQTIFQKQVNLGYRD